MDFHIFYGSGCAFMLMLMQDMLNVFAAEQALLTVSPSNIVNVDQKVTLTCVFQSSINLPVYFKYKNTTILCALERNNTAGCKNTPQSCLALYDALCPNATQFSVQLRVPMTWNKVSIFCEASFINKSNDVVFDVKVQVTSVELAPITIEVVAGELMNLNCTSSYCNPKSTIRWFMSSTDITMYSTNTTDKSGGLERTTSSLQKIVNKIDNGKEVHCTASNIPGETVISSQQLVTVWYKPEVTSTQSPYTVIEGHEALLECNVTDANPKTNIMLKWFNENDLENSIHTGSTYEIPYIGRNKSGSYICTAENIAGKSESKVIKIDVQYKPEVKAFPPNPYRVKEQQPATLTCKVTVANPNSTIKWKWFNTDNHDEVLHSGPNYTLVNIQRNMSGSYNCTASNSVGTSIPATVVIDVLYKPEVKVFPPNPYRVKEKQTATLMCKVTAANPNSTITWKWFNKDNHDDVLHSGPNYTLVNIQRNMSGSYNCIASTYVGTSIPATVVIDVLYNPIIQGKLHHVVNESELVTLSLIIISNPLANVTWYDDNKKLSTKEIIVPGNFTQKITSSFSIVSKCTDTKNFTVVTSNGLGQTVTDLVELIVNCKPKPDKKSITLGVTDQSGIEFSTTVISFPEPHYDLKNENGTTNIKMKDTFTMNAVNNFTIHFNQTIVDNNDYGSYNLTIYNTFGETIVIVNIIPQRKPDRPRIVEVTCEQTRTKVQWISSFNGGDRQNFTVIAFSGQYGISFTNPTFDQGENIVHMKYVENLHSSTVYDFYVSAENKHGIRSSENITCKTLGKDSKNDLPVIAGSAAAGGIALAIAIIIVVILLRKYMKIDKSAKHIERLHNVNENEENEADDGIKENSLYVSAGPRDDEKPEVAVYAAVAKKIPQSDNNSNLYADVKKSGRQDANKGTMISEVKPQKGLFKKDGKEKHKKGKKPKNRPGEADVYENSEDIAMSTNVDNVYSNAAQKGQNKQKERGYKNKDGLLYVEVNFDGKQGQDNPIIHGEDEKTDYATVEFPMPSALHKASGSEEL